MGALSDWPIWLIWVTFARSMGLCRCAAAGVAARVTADDEATKVLPPAAAFRHPDRQGGSC
jgi:hypothetical protein